MQFLKYPLSFDLVWGETQYKQHSLICTAHNRASHLIQED